MRERDCRCVCVCVCGVRVCGLLCVCVFSLLYVHGPMPIQSSNSTTSPFAFRWSSTNRLSAAGTCAASISVGTAAHERGRERSREVERICVGERCHVGSSRICASHTRTHAHTHTRTRMHLCHGATTRVSIVVASVRADMPHLHLSSRAHQRVPQSISSASSCPPLSQPATL